MRGRTILKVAGIGIVVLALLAAGAIAGAAWLGERKMQRMVEVRVVPVPYAKGPAAARAGKYLFESRGCAQCHGDDGRGIAFIDTPQGMYVKSPNITSGPGGVVSDYNEGDWVRAIRHGVSPKGHALLNMPSEDYNRMSDADLAALVAYTRALPPVAGESAVIRLPMIVKALYGLGALQDASEKIDHRRPPAQPVRAAVSVEHGAYVANMCVRCHGSELATLISRYDTAEKFVAMMRTGKRPDGTAVDQSMPFTTLRNMNDVDLNAMYAYLKTLPARRPGER